MHNAGVLEIALGLTLTYLALSLVCSALNECGSTMLNRYGTHLPNAIAAEPGQGWTALHFAARGQKEAIVKSLRDAGPDVDPVDVFGNTPLLRAVVSTSTPSFALIKALLKRGADPRPKNFHDASPFEFARRGGDEALVKILESHSSCDPGTSSRSVPVSLERPPHVRLDCARNRPRTDLALPRAGGKAAEPIIPRHEALKRGISWDDDSLENVLLGGLPTPFQTVFGPARYVDPGRVGVLGEKLSKVAPEAFNDWYDPEYLTELKVPPIIGTILILPAGSSPIV